MKTEELKALRESYTDPAASWHLREGGHCGTWTAYRLSPVQCTDSGGMRKQDAELIIESPKVILRLCDEIERLQAKIDILEPMVRNFRDPMPET